MGLIMTRLFTKTAHRAWAERTRKDLVKMFLNATNHHHTCVQKRTFLMKSLVHTPKHLWIIEQFAFSLIYFVHSWWGAAWNGKKNNKHLPCDQKAWRKQQPKILMVTPPSPDKNPGTFAKQIWILKTLSNLPISNKQILLYIFIYLFNAIIRAYHH